MTMNLADVGACAGCGRVVRLRGASPQGRICSNCCAKRRTGIVSNNSEAAITAYLDVHRLTSMVLVVTGRRYGHPESMKPDPMRCCER